MGHKKYATSIGKYKQLKENERWKIEAFLRAGLNSRDIAEKLGRNPSTITREIKRGKVKQTQWDLSETVIYMADHAQRDCREKQGNKGRPLKIKGDEELISHISMRICKAKYSPAAVVGEIEQKSLSFITKICVKTLYNYIRGGVLSDVEEVDLLYGEKRKRKYRKVSKGRRSDIFKSIEERPKEAEERTTFGHWEMDVVKGAAKTKACLLTFSERMTRQEIIRKMKSCTVEEVDKIMSELEKKLGCSFSRIFKTITVDNGSEFLDWKRLEESKIKPGTQRTKIYYAHPYSSFERGTNENQNRMIRRFIKKGLDISKIAETTVKAVQNWINSYPRAIFNYKTASNITNRFFTRKTCEVLGVVR